MILACDPGKITGFAWYDVETGAFHADQTPLRDFLVWADDRLGEGDEVVCESFVISKRTLTAAADAHWSMKGIGVLEHFCGRRGLKFTLQSPSEGKAFSTDDKLRAVGWYKSTKGGHRNDACRHLLVYALRNCSRDERLRTALRALLTDD